MDIKNLKKYFSSPFIVIAAICFIIGGILLLLPQNKKSQKVQNTKSIIVNRQQSTKTPIPSITPALLQKTTKQAQLPSSTPTPTIAQINPTSQPTPTTVSNNNIFKLQINDPNGNFSFSFTYQGGTNPCSILNNAKNSGDIKSVTINHYGPPLNSDYVKEINGFSDNWNFSINGNSMPKGCSNYNLNSGDNVLWKYN